MKVPKQDELWVLVTAAVVSDSAVIVWRGNVFCFYDGKLFDESHGQKISNFFLTNHGQKMTDTCKKTITLKQCMQFPPIFKGDFFDIIGIVLAWLFYLTAHVDKGTLMMWLWQLIFILLFLSLLCFISTPNSLLIRKVGWHFF
jgi:hypothetical protein